MARLRERRGFRAVRRNERRQRVPERLHALAARRADRHHRHVAKGRAHIRRRQPLREVALAEHDHLRRKAEKRRLVFLGQRACAVQHQRPHVRLHRVARLPKPGCIRQQDAHPADLHGLGQRIPRRAGNIRHNRALSAQQRVQQAALARVRPAAEHHAQALVLDAPRPRVAGRRQLRRNRLAGRRHLPRGLRLLHLVREVDCRRHGRQQGRDLLPRRPHERGNAALHLPHGAAHGAFAPRADHPHHALGLRQINAPVQKRPVGELARLGHPRARRHQQPQNLADQRLRSVAVNLRHVLPRVAVRRAHQHGHRLVRNVAILHHIAVGQHAVFQRLPILRPEHARYDPPAVRPAYADNRHAALSRRRRLRRDGIPILKHAPFLPLCFPICFDYTTTVRG